MQCKPIALAALACACAAGCRTTEEVLHDYERNLSVGNYCGSTEELLELADEKDGSQLLWRLMAASTLHLTNGREAEAIRHFDLAEDVLKNNDQKSVFAQGGEGALAMMTNDRVFSYDGGGLDRVFTCVYRGIDFMCIGDRDNARVEFNRAAQYQRNWLYDRRKDINAAEQKMRADVAASQRQNGAPVQDYSPYVDRAMSDASFGAQIRAKTGFDPATSGRLEALPQSAYVNAYAAHLAGVFRWVNGDNGLDDLKLAAAVKPGDACVARDFAECGQGGRPSNHVCIWAEDGLCPIREEWEVHLPLFLIPYAGYFVKHAGMALPVLRERAYGATVWNAVAGGRSLPFAEIESVDHLVRTEYDVFMRGALAREITRVIVKVGLQVALGATAANVRDDDTRLALELVQVGVALWSATTTAADLRSWTALPKRVMAVRLDRPADGTIQVIADGQPIPLTVPPGNSLVFIRKPGPSAPPVVKMVTFQQFFSKNCQTGGGMSPNPRVKPKRKR